MPSRNNIIKTQNVSIGYRKNGVDKVVTHGINITLQPGKITALIGANGAGKSTLLKTLTGMLPPLGGEVELNGKPIDTYNLQELAQQMAVVLTEKIPPGNLSVYELIALGRQPYTNWLGKLTDADRNIIENALKLTQTTHLSQQKYFELSDGQLQKVLIARALAQDTPFIILDEPTTHLDLLHKVQVLRLLKTLAHSQNKCILYSTHDLDLALQMSDEIIICAHNTVQQGTLEQLIHQKAFDTLFEGENIMFDSANARFTYKTN